MRLDEDQKIVKTLGISEQEEIAREHITAECAYGKHLYGNHLIMNSLNGA